MMSEYCSDIETDFWIETVSQNELVLCIVQYITDYLTTCQLMQLTVNATDGLERLVYKKAYVFLE